MTLQKTFSYLLSTFSIIGSIECLLFTSIHQKITVVLAVNQHLL